MNSKAIGTLATRTAAVHDFLQATLLTCLEDQGEQGLLHHAAIVDAFFKAGLIKSAEKIAFSDIVRLEVKKYAIKHHESYTEAERERYVSYVAAEDGRRGRNAQLEPVKVQFEFNEPPPPPLERTHGKTRYYVRRPVRRKRASATR